MAIKAVIFDWDLTLASTFWFRTRLFWHFCKKTGLPFWSLIRDLRKLFGMTMFEIFHLQKRISWAQGLRLYRKEFHEHAGLIRVHVAVLHALHAQGVKVAVISNDMEEHIKWYLEQRGIRIPVFSTNTHPKPNPLILRKMLKHLHVMPSEAVYVGDHPHDIQFGKNAGTRTIGYANLLHGLRSLGKEKPDAVVQSLDEIPSLIKKFS